MNVQRQIHLSSCKNKHLIFLLIIIYQPFFFASAAAFISGSVIKCFDEGQDVKVPFLDDDPCIRCKCLNQEIVCERDLCSHSKKCTDNGKTYRTGETWNNGTCNKCTCENGDVICKTQLCAKLTCPDNYHIVHNPGDCCPSCVENDGECSLMGNDDNEMTLTTFDRRSSQFNGKCNYVLSRECTAKSFTIHLTHGPINITSNGEEKFGNDSTTSLVVKVEKTKVRLTRMNQKSWHIRVGKRTGSLPFVKLGVMTVIQTQQSILVRTNIGIKVSWDGSRELKISIPSRLKGNVCGLCGNFNGNASDDRLMKTGRQAKTDKQLFESWKVGKRTGVCADPSPIRAVPVLADDECSGNWKKKVEAMSKCNELKDISLRSCHRRIAITPFYKKCLNDLCGCGGNDCHCLSIRSYVSQCRSLGLRISDLKILESCPAIKETDLMRVEDPRWTPNESSAQNRRAKGQPRKKPRMRRTNVQS